MVFRFLFPKKHLFVAGMPKSGTTFLIRAMMKSAIYDEDYPPVNSKKVIPIDFFNSTKHFSEAEFSVVKNKTTVGKMHMVGDRADIDFLNKHKFFTVFIYRNLFDVIESMKRHFDGLDKKIVIPEYHQLSDTKKYDGVIEYFVPNLLKMYHNFTSAPLKKIANLSYSQLLADPHCEMHKVLTRAEIRFNDDILKEAVQQKYGTFRGGTSGKGRQLLSDQQIEKVYEKISLHKDSYDFDPFVNE